MHHALERYFPEKRLFLKSDTETRFVRLKPGTQALAAVGSCFIVGWTIIATAMLLMDTIGSGSLREQAAREQAMYEARIGALSEERDARAEEALAAQNRFNVALAEISSMQSQLLASEERRAELEKGIGAIQTTMREAVEARLAAETKTEALLAQLEQATGTMETKVARVDDIASTVDYLTAALSEIAGERDEVIAKAEGLEAEIDEMIFDIKLAEERNDRIFEQLEEAVSVSIEPLDKMFRAAGLPADSIIEQVRRGYSGQGGPLTPVTFSTKGLPPDADTLRANEILEKLDRLNVYRIAAEKAPFAQPVKAAYRFTSGFGNRRDPKTGGNRMHNGADFASSYGTAIYATGDGVVTHAGWQGGYGRLVTIQHEWGIETRYAHMSNIRVKVGQRVSRGDRIGDMGNSGRSTGTHLHYEVRVSDEPVNPMTFIRAARDVF